MFLESPRFPDEIAWGAVGGPEFHTLVVDSPAGAEYREQQWPFGPVLYDLSLTHRGDAVTRQLLTFFRLCAGQAHGFRFHDFQPGEATGTEELLGLGDGETATFQLVKHYTIGGLAYQRTILKPVEGSVTCSVGGVVKPPGTFFVNSRSGRLTLFPAPAQDAAVRASFTFDVPVRFLTDWLAIRLVDPAPVYTWDSIQLKEIRPDVGASGPLVESWDWSDPWTVQPETPLWSYRFEEGP